MMQGTSFPARRLYLFWGQMLAAQFLGGVLAALPLAYFDTEGPPRWPIMLMLSVVTHGLILLARVVRDRAWLLPLPLLTAGVSCQAILTAVLDMAGHQGLNLHGVRWQVRLGYCWR